MFLSKCLAVTSLLLSIAYGDCYLQSARGGNNRLDEANRDRTNGNRLFDSQNNDRGGYNVGKLSYYVGEKVPISWSNQHGSSTYQMKDTEFVLQYACDELMRDGSSTNRIPREPKQCAMFDCDTDVEYGRHESWADYMYCRATSRNKGLFTANQNLRNRHAAIYTRQNPGGTRRGYECPEERDYYPYWRPSIWRDMAIYTNYPQRCGAYRDESQNVKARWACIYDDYYWDEVLKGYVANANGELPITEEECNNSPNYTVPSTNATRSMYSWQRFDDFGISPPDCLTSSATRANHHGTLGGRSYYTYTWEVPDYVNTASETCCVIRIRYNITTDDYQAWESESSIGPGLDYKNNSLVNQPDPDDDPAWVKIWENFKLTYDDIYQSFDGNRDGNPQQKSRGYVFINNPRVDPFGHMFNESDGTGVRVQLQLAINTNQFGRTFQDRTHCFQILDRPNGISGDDEITLITVQGKRGNIVQVYPATEYFFMPEPAYVPIGSYAHFCWTGSNTNPNNNDGQGKRGTDRSNICPLTQPQYDKEAQGYSIVDGNTGEGAIGDLGNNYADFVRNPEYELPEYYDFANKRDVSSPRLAGLSEDVVTALCLQRRIDDDSLLDYGNMEELDDAGTTYCTEPVEVRDEGLWNFLCTRNNNFSNRSQKGSMEVGNAQYTTAEINSQGATISSGSGQAQLVVQAGMVTESDTLLITITTWANTGEESTIVEVSGADGGEFSSETLVDGGWLELWIPYTPKSLNTPVVEHKKSDDSSWKEKGEAAMEYDDDLDTHYAVININDGGYYKAVNILDWGMLLIFIVFILAFIGCAAGLMVKKCKQ